MKKILLIPMRRIYILVFLAFGITGKLFSQQTITISGASPVGPGAQETYTASFNYSLNPYTTLTWSVTGGTIDYAVTNPTLQSIYCIVTWDDDPYGSGTVSLYEDMNSVTGDKPVDICGEADGGPDVTICSGGSVVIGVPAQPGCSYSWSPTTGLNNPNIAQPTASPTTTTTYTVTMTQTNGCPVTQTSLTVTVGPPTPVVSPAGPINYYYQYESPRPITLTSTGANTYQWYKNNSPITGATNQSYNNINEMPSINPFLGTITIQYKVITNCATSNTVTVNYIPCDNPSDYPVSMQYWVCESVFGTSPFYVQLYAPNLGTGTVSTWWLETPNNNPLSINSSGHLTYSGSGDYGDGIFTKSSLANGTETYIYHPFDVNGSCRPGSSPFSRANEQASTIKAGIYPNPASTQVTISSTNSIKRVEIYAMFGSVVSQTQTNGSKTISIDIRGLKPGVYSCKVFTDKGIEYLKFAVQR